MPSIAISAKCAACGSNWGSAAAWSPQYKEVVAFGILVLVMVLRPQGLLAKRGALAAAG